MLDELGVAYEAQGRLGPPHARAPVRVTPRTRPRRGLKVIIAGAGGAAHLPGMAASMTALPVLGVPVESKALDGHRQPALDRADAGRASRWHAGDRRGRRDNAGLLAAAILALADAALAERLAALRAAADRGVAGDRDCPDCIAPARLDHRHPRRRPARPHAGAGRRPARLRLHSTRPSGSGPAAQSPPAHRRRVRRPRRSPRFARRVDVVTFEFENVPTAAARRARRRRRRCARRRGAGVAQDRLARRASSTPRRPPPRRSRAVDDASRPRRGARALGAPAILKTRRVGYDGKGQARVERRRGRAAWDARRRQRRSILEGARRLRARVSIAARARPDGEVAVPRRAAKPRRRHPAPLTSPRRPALREAIAQREGSPRRSPTRSTMSACWRWRCSRSPTRPRGQRDRAARPQLRPLDHGRLRRPSSSSIARHRGLPLGPTALTGRRDDQPDRRRRPRLARARAPSPARVCLYGKPRPAPAARWATSPACSTTKPPPVAGEGFHRSRGARAYCAGRAAAGASAMPGSVITSIGRPSVSSCGRTLAASPTTIQTKLGRLM